MLEIAVRNRSCDAVSKRIKDHVYCPARQRELLLAIIVLKYLRSKKKGLHSDLEMKSQVRKGGSHPSVL